MAEMTPLNPPISKNETGGSFEVKVMVSGRLVGRVINHRTGETRNIIQFEDQKPWNNVPNSPIFLAVIHSD